MLHKQKKLPIKFKDFDFEILPLTVEKREASANIYSIFALLAPTY